MSEAQHEDDRKSSPAAAKPPARPASKRRRGRGAGGGRQQSPSGPATASYALPLALVALLLAVGALVGGYFIWHEVTRQAGWQREVLAQIDGRNQAMDERIRTLGSRLDADLAAAARARSALEQRLQGLGSSQQALENAIGLLRAQLGRSHDDWTLAETRYLLHVANQRLLLLRDPATALAALEDADQRLAGLGDPAYVPVREEIAREIAALRQLQLPDYEGLALRLASLTGQVEALPLAGSQYRPGERTAQPGAEGAAQPAPAPVAGWRQALDEVGRALERLVVVRREDRPVAPMLPPEAQYFLYENLRLQLEAARLALLRQSPAAWRSSLQTVRDWLQAHFDTESPATRSLLTAVDELLAIDIRPELPDISASLRLLREQMVLSEAEPPAADAEPAP
ncbi:uroporphyrinogen-III C-methyltransferase [Thiohalobacter sp. IOR34]|uniref:uroporphyrinogen-III C-methyltransferase n=1 Tax=Thiohalobacter sp. IOR34 TaxID=3057176 RepID=UPI0025B05782|nr:uroporphyrinogen-III C-methyltransferase [Thiohalobacter sp. IOR34]WJW75595.1 uroporphyrinogen-III C-methyltransferase [Thiohalobacter sp. IOR34]